MADSTQENAIPEGTVRLHREETYTIAEAAAVAADEAFENDGEISAAEGTDEASILKNLTEGVRNQDDLERDITYQANLVMIEKEDERDQKRIEKANATKNKLLSQQQIQKRRLDTLANNPLMRRRVQIEVERIDTEIATLESDILEIQQRIDTRHQHDGAENEVEGDHAGNRRMPNESQRDFLIRTGKITPFSRMPVRDLSGHHGDLTEALMDAEEEAEVEQSQIDIGAEPKSHQNLRLPGFAEEGVTTPIEDEFSLRPRKRRRLANGSDLSPAVVSDVDEEPSRARKASPAEESVGSSKSDFIDEGVSALDDDGVDGGLDDVRSKKDVSKAVIKPAEEIEDLSGIDDGNEKVYQSRLKSWVRRRSQARNNKQSERTLDITGNVDGEDDAEWFKPSPDGPDHHFENGLKLPGDIYPALFDYQKTGVQWLGELYAQQVGGIIGDEMGLGKTIQIISFLASLHYSKKLTKPIIVVAPATVLRQWVNEFHRWWPPLRVSILHTSGSGMLNVKSEGRIEDDEENYLGRRSEKPTKSNRSANKIVDRVVAQGHVLVTTYAGLQTYGDILIPVDWGYAVLDEGHKIRNPNTAITVYCKELRTANRVILSGTPMQNNLVELWSLFDFVYPMRLGTLVNFRNQFEIPIKLGGYANATNLQVMTATKCAETLKEAISPYLLQRVKADVAADLPKKSEQVLFCKLTKPQREAYELFLASDDMSSILNRTRQSLYGIDILRKICNHPDLLDPTLRRKPGYKWGNPHKSGKMQVVKAHWIHEIEE